jgi:carbon monoxide dehydrogenase subunit G
MSESTSYESRTGRLSCTPAEVFAFITDIRNFGRFVNEGTISGWKAEKDSCSFSVSMLGTVNVRLIEKEFCTRVLFQGDALSKNDFRIDVRISGEVEEPAEVNLSLNADMNPVMKMMAEKPIRQFMEMLMQEIENFRDWHELTV